MRLSLVALTASLAVLVTTAPVNKRDEATEELGVGVGLGIGKRDENLDVKVNADGTVSILKRDNANEDSLISTDLGGNLDVGKRYAASNDANGVGITINADGSVTVGKRAAAPDEDADISVGAGATVEA